MVKTEAELAKHGTDKELAIYSISDSFINIVWVTVSTFTCFGLVRVFETVGSIISLVWVVLLLAFALHALWTLGLNVLVLLPKFLMLFVDLPGFEREGLSFFWGLLIVVIYVINVCVYSLLAWYLFNYQIYKFGLL